MDVADARYWRKWHGAASRACCEEDGVILASLRARQRATAGRARASQVVVGVTIYAKASNTGIMAGVAASQEDEIRGEEAATVTICARRATPALLLLREVSSGYAREKKAERC